MRKLIVIIATGLMFGACAYTPQDANLTPILIVAEVNIGNGAEVSVRVVDERTQLTLGHRGSAFMKGAKITTDQDIAGLFNEHILQALKAKGFTPVAYSDGHHLQLRVDIRDLEYYTSTGFWTGGVHARAAIKVTATNAAKTYEKVYVSEDEKRVFFVPGAGANEEQLSATISGVLQKMMADQYLLSFLANGSFEMQGEEVISSTKLPTSMLVVQSDKKAKPKEYTSASAVATLSTQPPRLYALHLASYRKIESARSGWQVMLSEHSDLLEGLNPQVARAPDSDFLLLQAGPIANQEEARTLCQLLEARALYCSVAYYGGSPLN